MDTRYQAQTTEFKMDNNDIFGVGGDGQFNDLAKRHEQPNYKIEVKIALRRVLPAPVLTNLRRNFEDNGMKMDLDQRNHHIIVNGIPPNYQYNAQSVLAEVTEFDDGATLFTERIFK